MESKVAHKMFAAYFEGQQPVECTDAWHLSDGTQILLRPVKPQDSTLLSAMMSRLSTQTKYNRFHGTVNHLTSAHLRYMSCVDQQRHVAFVLTTHHNGEEHIIADARYVVDENTSDESAEFAIMVEDHWQRFGLAKHAMQALITAASNNGLQWLHGDVFAENCSMLALMEQCHFCCTPYIGDEKIIHAEISLTANNHLPSTNLNTLHASADYILQWVKSTRTFIHRLLHGGRYA